MKTNKAVAFLAVLMLSASIPQGAVLPFGIIVSEAHSGRTDGNGGHRDNKNKSGLGSYHYHCGGHKAHLHPDGVCPYNSTGTGGGSASAAATPAAEPAVPENIHLVFDAVYYADYNQDLYEAYGYDQDLLLKHFVETGMKEGRVAIDSFNVSVYKENNADLAQVYGDDLAAYYQHYMNGGCGEGRVCC